MARKNNSEPKTFAYEEFMAKARKEGRVRNEELSMKVLKPDLSLQARVNHIDVDHVRALHDILKNGQPLAPIVVFEIEELKGKTAVKTFKIADGFHRHEVYKREGLPGIPCVVVTGTLQEAIEYAASANQALSLPRTREDAKKAVFMLLENGWLERSAPWIGRTVGVSHSAVEKYRLEYSKTLNKTLPARFLAEDGRSFPTRLSRHVPVVREYARRDGKNQFSATVGGKFVYLGTDKTTAAAKLDHISSALVDPKSYSLTTCGFPAICVRRHVSVRAAQHGTVGGFWCGNIAVSVGTKIDTECILASVARVLIIASLNLGCRKLVVRNPHNVGSVRAVELAASAVGVEFMTLDEFVVAAKADDGDAAGMAVAQ